MLWVCRMSCNGELLLVLLLKLNCLYHYCSSNTSSSLVIILVSHMADHTNADLPGLFHDTMNIRQYADTSAQRTLCEKKNKNDHYAAAARTSVTHFN